MHPSAVAVSQSGSHAANATSGHRNPPPNDSPYPASNGTTSSSAIAPPSARTCRKREKKNVAGGIGAAASISRSLDRKNAGSAVTMQLRISTEPMLSSENASTRPAIAVPMESTPVR